MKKFLPLIFVFLAARLFSQNIKPISFSSYAFCPAGIKNFMACYPDIKYSATFDRYAKDWRIELTTDLYFKRSAKPKTKKSATFYWAGGRLLPKEELANQENYWILQYKYDNKLRNPKSYTQDEIERIKTFGSSENRKNTGGTPMFFFDWLYSAQSRAVIEEHIIRTTFLGKKTKIHERIYDQVKNVEKKILDKKDLFEVKRFISTLRSADAYHWREIAETSRKSFHSYGIAIDVLPKRIGSNAIYWSWEKDRSGDKWMLTPLEKRWTPGETVIKIFESEGFIWGGYWVIFDNMHFEYHPELINR